jgi:ribosomal protein L37AE/L43A
MGRGIDYAGPYSTLNRDIETGIRYGVIPQHAVLQVWVDGSEPDYGPATCPKCGNEAQAIGTYKGDDADDWERAKHECEDWECESCKYVFGSESAYGEEPMNYSYDKDGIEAVSDSSGDIFVLKSPYYTRAAFCSPCCPGACHLEDPCDDGEKAYCLPHDWFGDDEAPYPVFRVKDDSMMMSEVRSCPICGERVRLQDTTTADGRYIGTCGDAFTLEQWDSLYKVADDEEVAP